MEGDNSHLGVFRTFRFLGEKKAIELFDIIFKKGSLKGSFRKNKTNYETLQLSADSPYLWSVALKVARTGFHLFDGL